MQLMQLIHQQLIHAVNKDLYNRSTYYLLKDYKETEKSESK